MSYKDTMIKKYGSEEAWRAQARSWGSQGGSKPTEKLKGFARIKADGQLDRLREVSSKGGRISRRPSKKVADGPSA